MSPIQQSSPHGPIAVPGTGWVTATQFVPIDPRDIPPRQWLYGRHLIRKNVSVTVAPGGVGKSSLTIIQALELVTGREILGQWNAGPLKVWLFNLEDERSELDRRIAASMKHHGIEASDIGDRLFVDTGREQQLMLGHQVRDEVQLDRALIERLKSQLKEHRIDVLIVDPFVSSHRVNEMDNGKIDCIAKEWVRLAEECGCAVELVHHTRKLNGTEATSDASRGASSLISAARSSRVLQRLADDELSEAGVAGDGCTYFSVKRDKANLAASGEKETFRTVSVDLEQGDQVGVVELWKKPGLFEGLSVRDLLKVQNAIDGHEYRYSAQTGNDWVGNIVAHALSLSLPKDKRRIKKIIDVWIRSGALKKTMKKLDNGKTSPVLQVGEWASET
ncbi:Regulatory protein RepA [Roseovarius albus]|uniref:Regulatory protein RepA n=1 Tax=Roseovarius albus TaxID=1247867 RepID=A0A1X7A519_9RHOB|nr:AAA family ATPase [Roseovarius albus]SLN70774.1 Regulatory protein RepA [Roseovarius albus]